MTRSGRIWTAIAGGVFAWFHGLVFEVGDGAAKETSVAPSAQAFSASRSTDRAALALRWAPIHHQDVDRAGRHALDGKADYVARYDFDGDLQAGNNWENTGNPRYPLSAHAYYSVVETRTHWFIVYLFFHPRDWSATFFDTEHENDAEGLLVAVARDGSTYGSLKAAVTVAHRDFYSYVPRGSAWSDGEETVDGALELARHAGLSRPVTAQEAQGHGLKALPDYEIEEDGIVYYPSLDTAEVPEHPNDRHVLYRLVDIFEPGGLFDNRHNPALFASSGSFAGNEGGGCGASAFACTENAANAPWGWDDRNDGLARGALASDPALLVKSYFTIPEAVATTYTFNPYR